MNLLGFAYELLWITALIGGAALCAVLWQKWEDYRYDKIENEFFERIQEYRRDFE